MQNKHFENSLSSGLMYWDVYSSFSSSAEVNMMRPVCQALNSRCVLYWVRRRFW